jgi:hypothetical protein
MIVFLHGHGIAQSNEACARGGWRVSFWFEPQTSGEISVKRCLMSGLMSLLMYPAKVAVTGYCCGVMFLAYC